MNYLLIYIDGMARFAVARNIIKGYVVEGSTFWLQIENLGFNSSVSLNAKRDIINMFCFVFIYKNKKKQKKFLLA